VKIWETHLDNRADRARDQDEADTRWLSQHAGIDPAERLMKFDAWLRGRLLKTFLWPKDEDARNRLLGQCAAEMRAMFRELLGRGWLLDGTALTQQINLLFAPIAKAQREGKVADFYPYFRTAVRRYVGLNAEEISAQAHRSGAHQGTQTFGAIVAGLKLGQQSLTELLGARAAEVAVAKEETLRTRQARLRAKKQADAEPTLPGL